MKILDAWGPIAHGQKEAADLNNDTKVDKCDELMFMAQLLVHDGDIQW